MMFLRSPVSENDMLHPYPPVPFNVSQSITPAIGGTRRIRRFQESVFQKHQKSNLSSGKNKKSGPRGFLNQKQIFYLCHVIENGRTGRRKLKIILKKRKRG